MANPTEGLDILLGVAYNETDLTLEDGFRTTQCSPQNGMPMLWCDMNGHLAEQLSLGDALPQQTHIALTNLP